MTGAPGTEDVVAGWADLAQVLLAEPGRDDVCLAVVKAAPVLVDGCDHACIMIVEGSSTRTLSASSPTAALIDDLEQELGQGPCLDAISDGGYHHDPDIEDACEWPDLARVTLARTPVRSMAGFRLMVGDTKRGALNLFSERVGALGGRAADQGAVLAAFATVALDAADSRHRSTTLQDGLETNREIGVAVGVIMATRGLSREQAMTVLRGASSTMNRKLNEVAGDVIRNAEASRST